ncbi:MAG: hypothetical protein LKJ99_04585 [Acidaminococcaceae bacterium]|nr:hypothetical protein [Acidaminococcaceae bacterium]MCI2110232.1 hypothetical protein [Acidaminococcaceae bacterium]
MALSHYKILVFTQSSDEENKELINAMKEAFAKEPEYEVVTATITSFFPNFLWSLFSGMASIIVNILPGIYRRLYDWSNHSQWSLYFRSLACNIFALAAGDFLRRVSPDAVIAFDPLSAGIIDVYKKLHAKLFSCVIVPEYSVHNWWMFARTNVYFFAEEALVPRHGLQPWQKAFSFGIPINKAFGEEYSRDYLRMKYGWKRDDRICLIMNWGKSELPIDDLVTSIINNYDPTMKFVALTGKNLNMMRQLRKLPYPIKVFGFVDAPAGLMNCADYIVTSDQGVLAAQILTIPAKYVIYEPSLGQEKANAYYLETLGAAKVAINPFEVANLIKEYDRDTNIFLGAMGKPSAADYIADAIMREMD